MSTAYEDSFISPLLRDPVLSKANYHLLARVVPHVVEKRYNAGEIVYRANDRASHLFLLIKGQVQLEPPETTSVMMQTPDGQLIPVGSTGISRPTKVTITSGHFGEESGTDAGTYIADAAALTEVTALLVPSQHLKLLIADRPALKAEFYLSLVNHFSTGARLKRRRAEKEETSEGDEGWGKVAGWCAALAAPAAALALGPWLGLESNASAFLAILAAITAMWVFGLVDEYVPGLFALLATIALGLAPAPVVLSGFASDGFFMAMSILGLGTVIVSSGFSYRFLLMLLLRLPNSRFWHNFGLLLTGTLLTPMVPSINGRVALLTPFMSDMVDILRYRVGGTAATQLAISAFTGASLFSAIFLSSKSVNFVVFGLLPAQSQDQFQWLAWLQAAAVTGIAMLLLHLLIATLYFRSDERERLTKEQVAAQLRLLGSMRQREWAAVVGIGLFMLGVVTSSLHGIQPPWLSLAILYAFLIFGFLRKSEFKEKIDWPFLVYLGSVVGIIGTFSYVGLTAWLVERLGALGQYMQQDFALFVLMLTGIIFVVRLAVPISATIVIMAAVFMPLADIYGVNPWVLGFIILVLGEMWFFPYQCSYYINFKELNRETGVADERVFLRFNLLMNLVKVAGVYASLPFWKWLGLI